jgi:hypothetical protein
MRAASAAVRHPSGDRASGGGSRSRITKLAAPTNRPIPERRGRRPSGKAGLALPVLVTD